VDYLVAGSFEALFQSAIPGRPAALVGAGYYDGMGLEDRFHGFLAIADQVDIDAGLYCSIFGQGTETAVRKGEGHVGVIKREGIGHHFKDQEADARREIVSQARSGFKGAEGFRDRGVQDDDLHRGLLGYDGTR
jgi:hypothetical protein